MTWNLILLHHSQVRYTSTKSVTNASSQYTTSNLRFHTKYYWRARSRHTADTTQWSTVWSFTTANYPAHVSPTNNAITVSLNPILDWGTISGINIYQYEYSTDPNFSSAVPVGTGTTSQVSLVSLSYGQTYYWRVRCAHCCRYQRLEYSMEFHDPVPTHPHRWY